MSSHVSTFAPSGRLDGDAANELRQEVTDAIKNESDIILLNLQDVNFMNSSAIGALVAMKKAVKGAGKQLYICSISDQVRIIFELTRVDKVFKPFADHAEFEAEVLASS